MIFAAAGIGFAQEGGGGKPDGGKLKAYQIAFITERLKLTPEEAQRFWPVFNKYEDELRITRIQNRQATEVEMEEKMLNVRKKYFDEFAKVLNNKERADRVYKVDREFKDIVRKEMMERRQLRQQNKHPFKQ